MIQRRWKRVLVVDDEPTICELIAETLRESGYRVDTASNGAEALEVMRGRVPNAIVLDVMMPRLNAYGFVARLRVTPGFASIPILIVTASYGAYEAAERLGRVRPETVGQARRLPGMTPAAVGLLLVHLKRTGLFQLR